ncbi:MAG: 6-hydroxynicotinate reductase [Candidatus Symbiobacter sp.]|nr:6-hydroxynicotinate reductase [Candidatus Symbiobacter sp.]
MTAQAAAEKTEKTDKIECNACPVLCRISEGKTGACDRYGNQAGKLVRMDAVLFLHRGGNSDAAITDNPMPFIAASDDNQPARNPPYTNQEVFVTGIGSSTTYPDYKPAPFIVQSRQKDIDMVTVVTEGIFSYCSFRVKIDTDRYLGPEQAAITYQGEKVGHVTTAEYGSQMLSLGGVHHLTGGSKKEGRATVDLMQNLGNKQAVAVAIEGGAELILQAGKAPIVNGVPEQRMRVGCGSATIGIFAKQFQTIADEVVVVDDHITGILTEHQAGCCLDMKPSGIRIRGRRSTPGRYFQVANPGTGWGGTDIADPLSLIEGWNAKQAWPGMRLLMTSTTGEHAEWFILDENLVPQRGDMPPEVQQVVARIGENCEASLATVLFVGGAGGSLRAGATNNPVKLTQYIKRALVNVTCGGAPAYVWPGGGITLMVDVARMPDNSFGMVPTPAIVAPIEFTMRLGDYLDLGGHADQIRTLDQAMQYGAWHDDGAPKSRRMRAMAGGNPWPLQATPLIG